MGYLSKEQYNRRAWAAARRNQLKLSFFNQNRTPSIGDSVTTADFYDVISKQTTYDKSLCAASNKILNEMQMSELKKNLSKIYPFISSTNTFTGSNVEDYSSDGVVLIDIDDTTATSVFFDDTTVFDSFENSDKHSTFKEIQKQCPWIAYSGRYPFTNSGDIRSLVW